MKTNEYYTNRLNQSETEEIKNEIIKDCDFKKCNGMFIFDDNGNIIQSTISITGHMRCK